MTEYSSARRYVVPESVLVVSGAYLARRVDELLALAAGVFSLGLLGLWHGRSLADLLARREVARG